MPKNERGFSLLEMIIVLAILSLVMAVTMTAINDVQKRARIEGAKVDLTQESREFVDQIVRDLHASGYPTAAMYAAAPPANTVAVGLLTATATSISFEGDVESNGNVEVVTYNLISDPANPGQCPCILQRSQLAKGVAGTNFTQEVDQVINSAGGGAAWVIAGTTGTVTHDVRYATYKTDPIFRYFGQNGAELAPPIADLTQVRAIRVTVNTLSSVMDPVSRVFPASSITAAARIANR
jgi:prepilin-type N-terminal cleavage/methylation domain-containing protein